MVTKNLIIDVYVAKNLIIDVYGGKELNYLCLWWQRTKLLMSMVAKNLIIDV